MKIGKGNELGLSTTYYFSDFEEEWNAKDLYYEFKELGAIEEIVIPTKKDWRGKKYGLVRFVNVYEERVMETKLNNIMLNGKKIIANLSKYKRNELIKHSRISGGIKMQDRGENGRGKNEVVIVGGRVQGSVFVKATSQKSFAEAVKGNQSNNNKIEKETNKSFIFNSSL